MTRAGLGCQRSSGRRTELGSKTMTKTINWRQAVRVMTDCMAFVLAAALFGVPFALVLFSPFWMGV